MARSFRELWLDYQANPSGWRVVRTVAAPSLNRRNKGGLSIQEVLEHTETGEQMVRHTVLKADGTPFQPSHFRPQWK